MQAGLVPSHVSYETKHRQNDYLQKTSLNGPDGGTKDLNQNHSLQMVSM